MSLQEIFEDLALGNGIWKQFWMNLSEKVVNETYI